jgi:hypothetical protein
MRKVALWAGMVGIAFGFNLRAQESWVSVGAGQDPQLRVERSDEQGIRFSLNFPGFEAAPQDLSDQPVPASLRRTTERFSFKGAGSWGDLGGPELPVLRKVVLMPERSGWRFEVVSADYVELTGHIPIPLQEEMLETPDGAVKPAFHFDEEAYRQDRWFPEQPVELDKPVIMRDFRLGRFTMAPIQFNPARGLLRVYRNIEIEISFEGPGDNPIEHPRAQKSRVIANLVNSMVLNPYDELDEQGVLGGYLFITPSTLQSTLQTGLVEWKKEKGFPCTVANTTQTGSTNSQIKSYIQNIYNTWPIPPDYVILVGDVDSPYNMPCFNYTDGNPTDQTYVLLEGSDYFPDMQIGRLSVDSQTDLQVVCAKIRNYEKDPYMTSTTWFTRGLMVYDYSWSESCQTTKWNCRDYMLADGYTSITEVTNPPNYSGAALINAAINTGVTFVNYRGSGMYSGWTPPNYYSSDIYNLNNGFKLPVITSIVCGGGNYASTGTDPCFGEVWIRAGTPTTPKGAVSFTGPTSLYTHTRWNNCLDGGIYQGIFGEGISDFGSALLRGKMELYYGMPWNQGGGTTTNSVECYFHIYNILGDPGLAMWTGIPATLTVTHPTSLPLGVNSFQLTVASGGNPVEEALVCVYNSANSYQEIAWSDADGAVWLELTDAAAGAYTVTVTGKNLDTYSGTLTIGQQSVALGINSFTLDDDQSGESNGDGDGQFNPGETIELAVVLRNSGSSQTATGVSATIASSDPFVTITQNALTGPDAAPGANSPLTDDFNIALSQEAPHGHVAPFSLLASCAQGSWTNVINLTVVSGLAEAINDTVLAPGGYLNPGQTANVGITLSNSGGDPLTNCSGILSSPNTLLTVTDSYGVWGTIAAGATATNVGNPFALQASSNCPPGTVVPLQLRVTSGANTDTLTVPFTVGLVSTSDPAGPDAYGYRCFDSRDFQYEQTPTYSWVEASTQAGQVTLNLPDYGNEQDCVVQQNLPFTFRYYGQTYNQISICSNGWIAMGNTLYTSFRNWNIPGALGPPAMIAPFWDDLQLGGGGSAHFWSDAANHRVIVEWKDAHTAGGWGLNRFEVILNDPAYYPTSTQDGEIIFQYYTFNDVDAGENYCTIGIENQQQSDGVKVVYANLYTPGSSTIIAGVALKITPDIAYGPSVADVSVTLIPYGTPIIIPANGGRFNFNIAITNNEATMQSCAVWCNITLPDGSIWGPVLGPVDLTLPAGYSLNRDRTQVVSGHSPAGTYHYNAYVGGYPAAIWDSASFVFTKSSMGFGTLEGGWLNYGELFEGEIPAVVSEIPAQFELFGIRPNPFNPATTISYQLPASSHVRLEVFDLAGKVVVELVNGMQEAGVRQATWDAAGFPSGIYFCRLNAGAFRQVQKMVLLK